VFGRHRLCISRTLYGVRLVIANHSSYPRVGDSPASQRLRRAYARRETADLGEEAYREIVRDYIADIVAEQASAGCTLVTDGQVHWYDCISHLASLLDGVRIDGLHRFFDTNHYVRHPEITGPVTGRMHLVDDYTYATTVSPVPVKAVLTGPYTLAAHSITDDVEAAAFGYADVIADELRDLARAGCPLTQIEEPSILRGDVALARRALERAVAAKGSLPVSLVTYFGDAAPLYRELLDMPVEILGFDLVYSPGVVDEIVRQGADRPLALGIVDGRNTQMDPAGVAEIVERVAAAVRADELHVQPSCGLEYLPRDRAQRKLERLHTLFAGADA
jgi:5-methyltetrahydropteroyltriglutamate--homocysteine methyltransferase